MPDPSVASVGTYSNVFNANATPGVPSGVVNGSLVLIFVSDANGTVNTPTGFTALISYTAATPNEYVFWKRATGSESGTYTVVPGGVLHTLSAVAVRIADDDGTGSPFGSTNTANAASGTTTASVSLASANTGDLLLWHVGTGGAVTCTVPSSYTRQTASASQLIHVASRTHPSTGGTGGVTGTLGSSVNHTAALLAVKAAAVANSGRAFLAIL